MVSKAFKGLQRQFNGFQSTSKAKPPWGTMVSKAFNGLQRQFKGLYRN
jgi:hypothetical protein